MKKIALILLLIIFSCKDFIKEPPSEEDVFKTEMQKINFNQVENYPTFESCNDDKLESEKRKCFFETLSEEIRIKLLDDGLEKYLSDENSLTLKVTIEKDGHLKFLSILNDSLSADKLKIDSIIENKLVDFSEIIPAKNKGIDVRTEFQMSVKIK